MAMDVPTAQHCIAWDTQRVAVKGCSMPLPWQFDCCCVCYDSHGFYSSSGNQSTSGGGAPTFE